MTGVSYADTFNLTSCHVSGGCGTATQFGTVTLTQTGDVGNFVVALNSGNRIRGDGSGGGDQLFTIQRQPSRLHSHEHHRHAER